MPTRTKISDYTRTMDYLHSHEGYERFSYSWERHGNGAHTVDIAPAVVEVGEDIAYPMLTLRFNYNGAQTYPARRII